MKNTNSDKYGTWRTDWKVGDMAYISYFGVSQKGEIIKVGRTRARLRFKNQRGYTKEAWRPFKYIYELTTRGSDTTVRES